MQKAAIYAIVLISMSCTTQKSIIMAHKAENKPKIEKETIIGLSTLTIAGVLLFSIRFKANEK